MHEVSCDALQMYFFFSESEFFRTVSIYLDVCALTPRRHQVSTETSVLTCQANQETRIENYYVSLAMLRIFLNFGRRTGISNLWVGFSGRILLPEKCFRKYCSAVAECELGV